MIVARRKLLGLLAAAPLLPWCGRLTAASATKLDLWRPGDPGQRLLIRGRVTTQAGEPIGNATLYVRQADGTGVYTSQYQGSLQTAADGSYGFGTVLPGQYSSVKHIHLAIESDGRDTLFTEIRFKGDPNLEGDAYDQDAIVV